MIKFRFTAVNPDMTGVTPNFGGNLRPTSVGRFVRAYKIHELIKALDAVSIESRPVWKSMYLQFPYASAERYGGELAEGLFRRGICLPSSSSLSEAEQLYVINQVRRAARAPKLLPKMFEEHKNNRPWSIATAR